jgi:hypothetical protein
MATVRIRILTLRIILYVCPFNCMANTTNSSHLLQIDVESLQRSGISIVAVVTLMPAHLQAPVALTLLFEFAASLR